MEVNNRMDTLITTAKSVLQNNLCVQSGETVTIITDDALKDIAKLFFNASNELGNDSVLMEMTTRSKSGEEPPKQISDAMKS